MQDIRRMKSQKFSEIVSAFGKNGFFPFCPHISTRALKIQAFPHYEIYVFEMSKTWAILCKVFEKFSFRLKRFTTNYRKK